MIRNGMPWFIAFGQCDACLSFGQVLVCLFFGQVLVCLFFGQVLTCEDGDGAFVSFACFLSFLFDGRDLQVGGAVDGRQVWLDMWREKDSITEGVVGNWMKSMK